MSFKWIMERKETIFQKILIIRNVNFLDKGLIDFDNLEKIKVEERLCKSHLLLKI